MPIYRCWHSTVCQTLITTKFQLCVQLSIPAAHCPLQLVRRRCRVPSTPHKWRNIVWLNQARESPWQVNWNNISINVEAECCYQNVYLMKCFESTNSMGNDETVDWARVCIYKARKMCIFSHMLANSTELHVMAVGCNSHLAHTKHPRLAFSICVAEFHL